MIGMDGEWKLGNSVLSVQLDDNDNDYTGKKIKTFKLINWIIVTYWPSTQLSIKKQVHLVEDIGVSPWPVDGLNSVQLWRPQETGERQTII